MSWHNVKVYPVDTAFSRRVRLEHKKCVKCGRRGTGSEEIFGLEASHYFSRRKWNVRFDKDNVDCFCKACHKWGHQHPDQYEDWKYQQLGDKGFDLLTLRAWQPSTMGSSFYKKLTKKQSEELFQNLF